MCGTTRRWPTGEFVTKQPAREYWVSANAYVRPGREDTANDEVRLAEFDPSWAQQFDQMASWLRRAMGPDMALRVEHFGSTSIAGMPAKPVIDVLVEIPSFSAAKPRLGPLLGGETWEYWWYSGHMMFVKRRELAGPRTHHVHVAPRGHELWDRLAFRDYIRSHPRDASRYATLKLELAASHREDRERYTQAKTDFVREITSKALRRK